MPKLLPPTDGEYKTFSKPDLKDISSEDKLSQGNATMILGNCGSVEETLMAKLQWASKDACVVQAQCNEQVNT